MPGSRPPSGWEPKKEPPTPSLSPGHVQGQRVWGTVTHRSAPVTKQILKLIHTRPHCTLTHTDTHTHIPTATHTPWYTFIHTYTPCIHPHTLTHTLTHTPAAPHTPRCGEDERPGVAWSVSSSPLLSLFLSHMGPLSRTCQVLCQGAAERWHSCLHGAYSPVGETHTNQIIRHTPVSNKR